MEQENEHNNMNLC